MANGESVSAFSACSREELDPKRREIIDTVCENRKFFVGRARITARLFVRHQLALKRQEREGPRGKES
jgi:hypothetical protein